MSRQSRLTVSLLLNLLLTGGLLVAAQFAHSTSLAADAGHNLTDAMAILLALVAASLASRPASPRRSFGYDRASILAALANGVVLVAVTVSIAVFAIVRLLHPHPVRGGVVLLAAGISVLINLSVVWLLADDHHDLGVQSALLHALGDTLAAAVVALAGLLMMVTSGPLAERIDPIASLIVAVFIVTEAIKITRTSLQILLEGVPADIDLDEVRSALLGLDRVLDVHDLHVWSLSSSSRALSAHLVVEGDSSIDSTGPLLTSIKALLEETFDIAHATLELEGEGLCGHAHHD